MKNRDSKWIGWGSLGLALLAIPSAATIALQKQEAGDMVHTVDGTPLVESIARSLGRFERPSHSLAPMMQEAELAFSGEVVDLRYVKSADGAPGRTPIPYTFVTFRVDETLKGSCDPYLTLRFMGGLDAESGRTLHVSHVPEFAIGDTDVLFVQSQVTALSPMIPTLGGRLRVIDGRVCFDSGAPAELNSQGRLTRVVSEDLAEAAKLSAVLDVLRELPVDTATASFTSADPSVAFFSPDFTAVAPPADHVETVPPTTEELAERATVPAAVRPARRGTNQR